MNDTKQGEPASAASEVVIGGRYRVIRLLGKGGMGSVYEAENTWTKRRVALKVMRPEVADRAEYVRRFMQEAQAATQLAHPNIVDVLDMGEDRELGSLYIVQGFLTGRDLRAHLRVVRRMPVRESLDLVVPIMEALVMAHGRGIVHRDLKPDNIFLAETPRGVVPTLIDFGIVKVTGEDGGSNTSTGTLMGTPYYMAPEQARGDTALDARADVWSLGVVLYEMLSGARPATAANSNALIGKIIYEDPRPLSDAAPDLPPDVTAAVMGALQRDVRERYPSMQAFLDALLACQALASGVTTGAFARAVPLSYPSQPPRAPDALAASGAHGIPPRGSTGETLAPMVEPISSHTGLRHAGRGRRVGLVLGVGLVAALGITLGVGSALRSGASPSPVARPAAVVPAIPPPAAVVAPVVQQTLIVAPPPVAPPVVVAAPRVDPESADVPSTRRHGRRPQGSGTRPSLPSAPSAPTAPAPDQRRPGASINTTVPVMD